MESIIVHPVQDWWWECPFCGAYVETSDAVAPRIGEELYCEACGACVVVEKVE